MERYFGLTSLALSGRESRIAGALAGALKRLPSVRHLLRLRGERAAWLFDPFAHRG
jgi:hypothetical protein